MKAILRELITDFKAAARLSHPDSLYEALEQVHKIPDEVLPPSALVPLGAALAPFAPDLLIPYLDDKDPAVRGIVAAAVGTRAVQHKDIKLEVLDYISADPHAEVGAALGNALIEASRSTPGPLLQEVCQRWITSSQPNTVIVGLRLLPAARLEPEVIFQLLQPLNVATEPDVHAALAECLAALATRETEPPLAPMILALLTDWVHRPAPNVWLITRVLSSRWAHHYASEAISILNELVEEVGLVRPIVRALARLQSPDEKDNFEED